MKSYFSYPLSLRAVTQLNILEEGLINHPVDGFTESGRKGNEFRNLLRKIEEAEVHLV